MNEERPISLLLLSPDIKFAKDLQESTGKLCKAPFSIFPCTSGEKFMEYGNKHSFLAIFVDEHFSKPAAPDWVAKLRMPLSKELGNHEAPFFLLTTERNLEDNFAIVRQGYLDLFTKPLDPFLVLQKLQTYLPQRSFLKEDLLFSMDVKAGSEIAFSAQVTQTSEFAATLITDFEFKSGDALILFADMFSSTDGKRGQAAVRILDTKPENGKFITRVMFIGPPKAMLSAIRVWMKKQYVQASAGLGGKS